MEDGLRQVGAFEAKNTLGNCSTWSTRLAPARPISNREQARAAIQRIRERAEQRKFGPFDWSEWKNQPARESRARQFGDAGLVHPSACHPRLAVAQQDCRRDLQDWDYSELVPSSCSMTARSGGKSCCKVFQTRRGVTSS